MSCFIRNMEDDGTGKKMGGVGEEGRQGVKIDFHEHLRLNSVLNIYYILQVISHLHACQESESILNIAHEITFPLEVLLRRHQGDYFKGK